MGHQFEIKWFGLKDFIFTIWLRKRVACFQGLFLETRILWKSNILKRFILVSEYDNFIGINTHRYRLGSLGKTFTNRRFRFSSSGRDWRPHRGFRCFLVVDLSSFCWLCPWVFKNFLVSGLNCPFSSFHPKVTFFLFIHFLFFCLIVPSCTRKFKICSERVNDLSRGFWLKNKDNNLVGYEKLLKEKNLFSLSIHIRSKWTFNARNVSQGSWFRKKG